VRVTFVGLEEEHKIDIQVYLRELPHAPRYDFVDSLNDVEGSAEIVFADCGCVAQWMSGDWDSVSEDCPFYHDWANKTDRIVSEHLGTDFYFFTFLGERISDAIASDLNDRGCGNVKSIGDPLDFWER